MLMVVLGFIAILLVTFGVVIAMTRQSHQPGADHRAADGVDPHTREERGPRRRRGRPIAQDNASRPVWLAGTDPAAIQIRSSSPGTHLSGAQFDQRRYSDPEQFGFVLCRVLHNVAVRADDSDRPWATAALGLLPYGILRWKRGRRISAFNAVLAECIDMLARALRAGHSVAGALEMLAENSQEPAASEFGEIFKQINLGLPLREALLQLLDRVPSADLRVLVTAILVQRDTGGNLVEILDRTVFVIRERLRIQGEIQVQTAQGRLTGWILTALPVVMMVMLNVVNPGYSSILFHDPFGRS